MAALGCHAAIIGSSEPPEAHLPAAPAQPDFPVSRVRTSRALLDWRVAAVGRLSLDQGTVARRRLFPSWLRLASVGHVDRLASLIWSFLSQSRQRLEDVCVCDCVQGALLFLGAFGGKRRGPPESRLSGHVLFLRSFKFRPSLRIRSRDIRDRSAGVRGALLCRVRRRVGREVRDRLRGPLHRGLQVRGGRVLIPTTF